MTNVKHPCVPTPITATLAAANIVKVILSAHLLFRAKGSESVAVHPTNHNHPKNKHPYRFYWLTGGLATIIAAIIAVSLAQPSGSHSSSSGSGTSGSGSSGTGSSGTGSSGIVSTASNELLTSADMEQAVGGSWQSLAADSQSASCFTLPTSASKSVAVDLSEALGAQLYEVVDSFPSTANASQAYASFASATSNCTWQKTSKEGNTTRFTAVADSNAQEQDSASTTWDVQGVDAVLGGAPAHDGAICAVQSGDLDAFAYSTVDSSDSPSLNTFESNIEPMLAQKLLG